MQKFAKEDRNIFLSRNEKEPSLQRSYFEILCVMQGVCTVQTEDGETLNLKEGDVCFLPSDSIYAASGDTPVKILIKKKTLSRTLPTVFKRKTAIADFFGGEDCPYVLFRTGNDPDIKGRILTMCMESEGTFPVNTEDGTEDCTEDVLAGELSLLFLHLLQKRCFVRTAKTTMPEETADILAYIYRHFPYPTLSEAAHAFHYSESAFSRKVKVLTGRTFTELVEGIRIHYVKRLLLNTNRTIEDISYEAGYENPENLYRLFRRETGMTPNEYRRKTS